MAYWIYQTGGDGPNDYKLQARLLVWKAQPETATQVQKRYRTKINPGDQLFVWQKGSKRGFVGLVDVTSSPVDMREEIEIERLCCPDPATHGVALRITGRYTKAFPLLSEAVVAADPVAKTHYFFSGNMQRRRGTIHPLQDDQAKAILRLIENHVR